MTTQSDPPAHDPGAIDELQRELAESDAADAPAVAERLADHLGAMLDDDAVPDSQESGP